MRFELALRHDLPERLAAFRSGLLAHGHTEGADADLLVTWNRFGLNGMKADQVEARGGTVLVVENALWGNGFLGESWLSISRRFHHTAQPAYGPGRWDCMGVRLSPFRTAGETVVLAQRGIGHPAYRQPIGWPEDAQRRYGGRIRPHPGKQEGRPLAQDLAQCGRVVTWASGAAVKALMWGIPVTSEMPGWVAEQDNTEAGRLAMFRRLAWSHWTLEEIARGDPFYR